MSAKFIWATPTRLPKVIKLLPAMLQQVAVTLVRRYFPQILLPITMAVGFIGYSIENYLRKPVQAGELSKSTSELREERRLKSM